MNNVHVNQLKDRLASQLGFTADGAQNLITSLKLSDLDKVRLWCGLRFIDQDRDALRVLFFLESLVAIKQRDKSRQLKELFVDHAEEEEKIDLVDGFFFSRPFKFDNTRGEVRHTVFDDFSQDKTWISKNIDPSSVNWKKDCSSGQAPSCYCIQWLKDHLISIDTYVRSVVGHLYEMRCAVVHEAFPVIFFEPNRTDSALDVHPIGPKPDDFISHEVTIKPERFFEIGRNVARRYLLSKV